MEEKDTIFRPAMLLILETTNSLYLWLSDLSGLLPAGPLHQLLPPLHPAHPPLGPCHLLHLHLSCTNSILHLCTSAPLHIQTPSYLQFCTTAPLHPCTPAPLHPCTPAPLHPCTPGVPWTPAPPVPLHPLHPCNQESLCSTVCTKSQSLGPSSQSCTAVRLSFRQMVSSATLLFISNLSLAHPPKN